MKKILIAVAVLAALGVAQRGVAAISGSAHDFSGDAWNSGGEICEPCHVPHNTDMTVVELWNHSNTVTAAFTLYTGKGNLDATVGQPAGVSRACLSCHDGSISLDAFGGTAIAGTAGTEITGAALLGTDLSNDHPISFDYDAALAGTDGELHDPTATASGLGANIDDDLLFGAGNDQLECASCHDVHNTANQAKLLVMDNAGSALCLTCHDK